MQRIIKVLTNSPTGIVELVLTCGSWQEAQTIVDRLLETRLIACAEFIEIKSKFWWKDEISEGNEIKLIMKSYASLFDKVESEITKLHSYETFVLQAVPVVALSDAAQQWIDKEIRLLANDKIGPKYD